MPASARGFTLLETALAMVIVVVGVLAMVEAQRGFIISNGWSSQEATATYLANEIRERVRTLPRHDPVTGLSVVTGGGGQPQAQGVGLEAGEVTIDDFDDVDDFDAVTFGNGGNFDGPIDAFGRVIPEIDIAGNVVINPQTNQPMALRGWSQAVTVRKVSAYDYSTIRGWVDTDPPLGAFNGRPVDQFPLLVTVTVRYQAPDQVAAQDVTTVSWIVPP
ncbi:MAG: hypothetical protein ACKVW3_06685 [Phycisphaerales bacterium]